MSEKKPDRRTLKTRKAICDAFAELLYEKELHKITVQEISDKADVNRVTFYNHYLDVYDLYDKLEADVLVELGLLILQLDEMRSEEFFSCLIGYISDKRNIFRMIFSPIGTNRLRDKFGRLMEGLFSKLTAEKLESGELLPDDTVTASANANAQPAPQIWLEKNLQRVMAKRLLMNCVNSLGM